MNSGTLAVKGRRAGQSPWVERLGRIGLVAKGVLYAVVAILAVKVALEDDSALTSVVTAVAERGSHLVGLAKSEPSLEDVFVELVGRGFGDDDGKAPS